MNRKQRRALKLHKLEKLPPARQDGRPLYYDIAPVETAACYYCEKGGLHDIKYRQFEAFMADPANAPTGNARDLMTVCHRHLPEDAVIYNPGTNLCRNKSGDNTWMEDSPDMDPNSKIAKMAGVPQKS